jgi:predicted DsbA family dithiol-disulfide isomerase
MVARLTRIATEQNIPMVFSEVIPNSRHALEASEYARDLGQHTDFHQTVFHKFYGLGEDLRGWELLRNAAVEIGLDPDAMQHATEVETYRPRVNKKILAAHQRGITSVPAYIFNDQYAIFGAQPYSVFQDLMTRILNGSLASPDMEA